MLRRPTLKWTIRTLLTAAMLVLSLVPLSAQDSPAKVLVMTGRVSVLRDGTEWALNASSLVQPKQFIVTGPDGYAKFQVADGSTFEVFQNSKVQFRENPFSFTDLLDVLIGRVKVYIEHRNGPNPNRVTTQTAVISVRGTIFDVVVEDADDTTLVSVDEGLVEVRHRILPGETLLHPGESVRVYKNQPLARQLDKGNIIHQALRAAAQAAYDAVYSRPGGIGSPGGGSVPTAGAGGAQGDKGKGGSGGSNAPPAPPPPPPPAPAH